MNVLLFLILSNTCLAAVIIRHFQMNQFSIKKKQPRMKLHHVLRNVETKINTFR